LDRLTPEQKRAGNQFIEEVRQIERTYGAGSPAQAKLVRRVSKAIGGAVGRMVLNPSALFVMQKLAAKTRRVGD
jgi:hypothetical protein